MAERKSPTHEVLVVCPPGLESVVADELDSLRVRHTRAEKGGVSCRLTTRQLYAANLFLRCATRLLVRVGRFEARSFTELEEAAARIDWAPWLGTNTSPRFRVTTHRSRLWHDAAVAERLSRVLGDRALTDREQLVVVRAVGNRFTVSADSSGAPLHERGWRQATARAPLRESVAAGLLAASSWNSGSPLVDPMCGSGTIAIEAALLASGMAAGSGRPMAFHEWPSFQPGTWASVTAEADNRRSEARDPVPILAVDRDAGAVESARANAQRAGVSSLIEWRTGAISDLTPPSTHPEIPGLVLTNPPWGGRLSTGGDLRNLYATFGRVVRDRFEGWRIGVLIADRGLARQIRPGLSETLRLELGGRRAWLLTGPAGR
ncbi:MAG: class I SAM-dependent RNA methyltransferase [Actinomycetota bacterium]|nr:class I SAM-dependent RNA methyltransferase [Actinomycetota bacterium]